MGEGGGGLTLNILSVTKYYNIRNPCPTLEMYSLPAGESAFTTDRHFIVTRPSTAVVTEKVRVVKETERSLLLLLLLLSSSFDGIPPGEKLYAAISIHAAEDAFLFSFNENNAYYARLLLYLRYKKNVKN